MELKRGILLALILILSLFFISKFVGYSIQTLSEVTIHTGILVKAYTFDGSTTNFLHLNDSQLQAVYNMILERTQYGRIIFNENVNLTENAENNTIDLDSNINISDNYISLASQFTSLQKSADIYLYNLTFRNPLVIKDGSICTDCRIASYSGGILLFSVTNFSGEYYAIENPQVTSPSSGSSGGGATIIRNFAINKDIIQVNLKQGENKRETIEVMNIGNTAENITIDYGELKNFLVLSEDSFTLEPGKVEIINADFFAKEDEIPDAYTGRITIENGEAKKIINVIVEVNAKKPLFDISTRVQQKELSKGGNITANISITNMGDIKKMDISLYYAIKSFDGEIISFRQESIAITDKLNLQRTLEIPQETQEGTYIFYAKISNENISAASVDTFEIKRIEIAQAKQNNFMIVIIAAILLVIALIILKITSRSRNLMKIQKKADKIKKLIEKDKEKAREKYNSLKNDYRNLTEREKEIIYPRLDELRKKLA